MDAIIVGAGGVTRALLRLLGEGWSVTVIEQTEERLQVLAGAGPVTTLVGDGSSEVVLRRAGLEHTEALIAATDDDAVNVAACRLALAAGVPRVAASIAHPERARDYAELGVRFVSRDQLAASRIAHIIEPRGIVTTEFVGGRASVIEFHLAGDSPVVGHALRDLPRGEWIVGAILRGEQLIIPHGDTVFAAGDMVTVVGSAGAFSETVRAFTSGEARFPLQYGTDIAVVLRDAGVTATFAEAAYLTRVTRAEGVIAIAPEREAEEAGEDPLPGELGEVADGVDVEVRRAPGGGEDTTLREVLRRESVGVLVVTPGRGLTAGLSLRRSWRLARSAEVALLVARGSQPYTRVFVPARLTSTGRLAARAGIDIARALGVPVTGIAIDEPAFARRGRGGDGRQAAIGWLKDEANVQGVSVDAVTREGNPVRMFVNEADAAGSGALAVLAGGPNGGLFRVSIAEHIAQRAACSVLIVPELS